MDATPAFPDYILDPATLGRRKKTSFSYKPNAAELKALSEALSLTSLKKTSFEGQITAAGKSDWVLSARLGASAVQPCTITLDPVTTRIDTEVVRRFVAEMPQYSNEQEEDEFGGIAMLEDDTLEPLGREIDLWRVLTEALALELPDYPRAEGAELGTLDVTEPGKDAMTDSDAKPFAGLAALMQQKDNGS